MKPKLFYLAMLFISIFFQNVTYAKGFFYVLETDSSKVYLFGSIHIAKSSAYPLDQIVDSVFNECKNVVFEINLKNLDPFQILAYGTIKDNSTLEQVIPKKYYNIVDSLFKKYSIPKFFYNKMQPWFAILFLINLDFIYSAPDFVEGVDLYFLKKIDSTKRVFELESLIEQINIFKSLYELSPEFFLEYFLIQTRQDTTSFNRTYNAWLKGDETPLLIELNTDFANEVEKEFNSILNEQRNLKMVSKIMDYLSSYETYFVIVGAAHLLGESGIVSLLKRNGYKVRRLL
ncbi:MAG: TraB/GumN family protein [Candidatus Kapaibacteriota bacterium]